MITARVHGWSQDVLYTLEHGLCTHAMFTGAQYTVPVFPARERSSCSWAGNMGSVSHFTVLKWVLTKQQANILLPFIVLTLLVGHQEGGGEVGTA